MFSANRDDRGRPTHYEIALGSIHHGEWWYWTDNKNRIYENLRIHPKIWIDGKLVDNPYTKPTKSELDTKLAEVQAAWDDKNDSYKSNRRAEYPSIADQLDDIYHNGIDGWKATIKTTKDKYSKS